MFVFSLFLFIEGVRVTQDYIKVTLTLTNGQTVNEGHVYPVRDFEKHPSLARKKENGNQSDEGKLLEICFSNSHPVNSITV